MRKRARIGSRRRRQEGGILLDALIALTILSLAAVSFFGYFPVLQRTHVLGAEEAKATQMAQKMVEHVSLMSPSTISASTLTAAGLIDSGQAASPFTFNNVAVDSTTNYSPSKVLRNGTGTLTLTNISDNSVMVTVTVSWKAESGVSKTVTMGTVLGGYRS